MIYEQKVRPHVHMNKKSVPMFSGANQQMIWGCQYDQVIKFIGNEAQIGHTDRGLLINRALTGQNPLDKMKNIYDLEGNLFEWTLETSSNTRTNRGNLCGYINYNNFDPASNRGVNGSTIGDLNYNFSSRSTLYIGV